MMAANMPSSADWTAPLDALYSAVGEPDLWGAAMDALCEALNAHSALLFTPCAQMLDMPHHHSKEYRLETAKDYLANFVNEDVYNVSAVSRDMFKMGLIATGEDLVPMYQLQETRFFKDFLVKHNQGHLLTSVPFDQNNQHQLPTTILSFYRPLSQQPFSQSEVDIFYRLMPHVQRAWLLHDQAEKYKVLNNGLQGALNQLSHGVILVDEQEKMQFANQVAKRFLSALYLSELKSMHTAKLSLPKSILQVANMSASKLTCKKVMLDQGEQWFVVAAPLARLPHLGLDEVSNSTVIWLTKDETNAKNNVCLMADLFRLTFTEAKVLELLLGNHTPQVIADSLNIKISTVRSHLSNLLIKTGSKRQQDLIRLSTAFEFIDAIN